MNKAVKGTYGYLKKKKIAVLTRTVIYFAISLALLFAGILTTGSRKNWLTIVAVLGCLPASKSLVNLIMYVRASGCSESVKSAVEAAEGSLVGMYDMYFTSYKKNFAISHMAVSGKNICGYTEEPNFDTRACEEHLQTLLKQDGHKNMTLKIFTDFTKYLERLKQLNALADDSGHEKTPEADDKVRITLYNVSL